MSARGAETSTPPARHVPPDPREAIRRLLTRRGYRLTRPRQAVLDVLATGPSVDVRAWLEPFEGGITLELRLDAVEFEGLDDRKVRIAKEVYPPTPPDAAKPAPTAVSLDRLVQLPRVQHDRVRTNVTVRDRETAVAGLVTRKSRAVLFLITPGIIPAEEKPAAAPEGRKRCALNARPSRTPS